MLVHTKKWMFCTWMEHFYTSISVTLFKNIFGEMYFSSILPDVSGAPRLVTVLGDREHAAARPRLRRRGHLRPVVGLVVEVAVPVVVVALKEAVTKLLKGRNIGNQV